MIPVSTFSPFLAIKIFSKCICTDETFYEFKWYHMFKQYQSFIWFLTHNTSSTTLAFVLKLYFHSSFIKNTRSFKNGFSFKSVMALLVSFDGTYNIFLKDNHTIFSLYHKCENLINYLLMIIQIFKCFSNYSNIVSYSRNMHLIIQFFWDESFT